MVREGEGEASPKPRSDRKMPDGETGQQCKLYFVNFVTIKLFSRKINLYNNSHRVRDISIDISMNNVRYRIVHVPYVAKYRTMLYFVQN